jgi:hypothetical protein
VEYPASVQVGEVTLVIEVKEVQPAVVSPTVTTSGEICAVSNRVHFPMARVFNVGFRLARSSSL